jgi:hypothetical protein
VPPQYDAIKKVYLDKGKSDKDAKTIAAKIFIAKGKGGSPSSRAKTLAADRTKPAKAARPFSQPPATKEVTYG